LAAIDHPRHGDRARGEDCVPSLPPRSPKISGPSDLFELGTLSAIRDNLLRSIVDFRALIDALQPSGEVVVVGQGFGAMTTAVLAAVDARVTRVVLNAPANSLLEMLEETREVSMCGPFFSGAAGAEVCVPDGACGCADSLADVRFRQIATWILDDVDPIAYARDLSGRPVLIQSGALDRMMPKGAARLEAALGSSARHESYVPIDHAFLTSWLDPAGEAARKDMIEFLTENH
jgi:pimeloyl-ACP methyl ester carboxylesterase